MMKMYDRNYMERACTLFSLATADLDRRLGTVDRRPLLPRAGDGVIALAHNKENLWRR
jgi:hypothetical protein